MCSVYCSVPGHTSSNSSGVSDQVINLMSSVVFFINVVHSCMSQTNKCFGHTYDTGCCSDFINLKWGKMELDLNIIPYRSNSMFLRKDFMVSKVFFRLIMVPRNHLYGFKYKFCSFVS